MGADEQPDGALAFAAACRDDESHVAEEHLRGLIAADAALRTRVQALGGVGPTVRFLTQRRHLLPTLDDASVPNGLCGWLEQQLLLAEPMHLIDVDDALAAARAGEHVDIVIRLEEFLRYLQPPDPTRWSRPFVDEAQQALLSACAAGDPELVASCLTEAGAVEARDAADWGPCEHAAKSGETALIALLVGAGAAMSWRAAAVACEAGDTAMLAALLAHDCPLRGPLDEDALWFAAKAGTLAAVAPMLCDAGAEVDVADRFGVTAWGVANAADKAVLEARGAEPVARREGRYGDDGLSPVMRALVAGESVGAGERDLNEAAACNDVARVRELLDEQYRLEPRIRLQSPERPLHLAACFDARPAAQLLLDRGYSPAEVNTPLPGGRHIGPEDSWELTPLDIAARKGHLDVVEVLMNTVDFFQGRRARRK